MTSHIRTALAVLIWALAVQGHFMVTDVVSNQVNYVGYNLSDWSENYTPITPQWQPHRPFPYQHQVIFPMDYTYTAAETATQTQNPDIICGVNSTNGKMYIPAQAGKPLTFRWTQVGHQGPVLTYLANCHGACTTVDKTTLRFFKIDHAGYNPPTNKSYFDMESWGAGIVHQWDDSWTTVIPEDIAPGNYVVRHEIIGLQNQTPQFYPSCINLRVVGRGTAEPAGVLGTELYQSKDVMVISQLLKATPFVYDIPGPTIYGGAATATQTFVTATATSTGIA
ncbi:glycoside hydrolase [Lindgomyces ingoldianus]|uniref:Glycoside hydrolase n=1 Tax=Lindgomyces ingoldianus TaxID=673940 RepID=A0ACB6R2X4_9PLEO|nr:glycoside hydrolase [Lindgomyces ingoldianus]KAF2473608.1 glycoside hydrolase [Lindgomyces ingoldianus]